LMRAEAPPADAKSPAVIAKLSLNPSDMALIICREEVRSDTAFRTPHRAYIHT
jgi:hypothetical protein